MGVTNALNLIDGLDGLSAGVGAIASFTLGDYRLARGKNRTGNIVFPSNRSYHWIFILQFSPCQNLYRRQWCAVSGGDAGYYINTGSSKRRRYFYFGCPYFNFRSSHPRYLFCYCSEKQKSSTSILRRPRTSSPPSVRERILTEKSSSFILWNKHLFGLIAILINTFVQNSTYSLLLLLFLFAFFWQWGKNLGVLDLPGGEKTVEKVKIFFILGTRPEVIKLAPVISSLSQEQEFEVKIINTGQHRDMAGSFLCLFGLSPHYNLDVMTAKQSLLSHLPNHKRIRRNFLSR